MCACGSMNMVPAASGTAPLNSSTSSKTAGLFLLNLTPEPQHGHISLAPDCAEKSLLSLLCWSAMLPYRFVLPTKAHDDRQRRRCEPLVARVLATLNHYYSLSRKSTTSVVVGAAPAGSSEDVAQDDLFDRGRRDRAVGRQVRLARDENGTIGRIVRNAAVRTFDQRRVQRDDIHQGGEAERALGEPPSDRKLREANGGIEKQLDGIVSGLPMDFDEAREVGRVAVIEPIVIGEPGVMACQCDEFAGAWMIEAECNLFSTVKDAVDAGKCRHDATDLLDQARVRHIDVRDLMIAHRERVRLTRVEQFAAALAAHAQQPGLAQRAVDMYRGRNGRDPV